MSLSVPSLPLKLHRTVYQEGPERGERRIHLVDQDGMDDAYSTLFVTSQIRNKNLSVSSEQAALVSINVLYAFCKSRGFNLLKRFQDGNYLAANERMALKDFAQTNFEKIKSLQKVVALGRVKRGHHYALPAVDAGTQYSRLTHIASYVGWLAQYLLAARVNKVRSEQIDDMVADLLALRPAKIKKQRDFDEKEFTPEDNARLNEIIPLDSELNPFEDRGVRLRNLLIIELLRQPGIRRGELLGLQMRDLELISGKLTVRRRHDSVEDPRTDQPLQKTEEREIPISRSLVKLIREYNDMRRSIPGTGKHRYLLVSHFGKTRGQPLTISGLDDVFKRIIKVAPDLAHLHRHKLRHFFSNELARLQQEEDPGNAEAHRRVRNHVAGRKPTSGVDGIYTKLYTAAEARKATLKVQDRMAKPVVPVARRRA